MKCIFARMKRGLESAAPVNPNFNLTRIRKRQRHSNFFCQPARTSIFQSSISPFLLPFSVLEFLLSLKDCANMAFRPIIGIIYEMRDPGARSVRAMEKESG